MNKNASIIVTEWDWFEMQLRVYALERRAALFSFFFEFDKEKEMVICRMHGPSIEETLRETTDKKELYEEYFFTWIRSVKRQAVKVLHYLPVLSQEFDVERHIEFQIIWDYGMGGAIVCRICGDSVSWDENTLDSFKMQKSSK